MESTDRRDRSLVRATVAGTLLQLLMVLAGHVNAVVAGLFAPVGMGISLIAGWLYALWATPARAGAAAGGGAIAGGVCAFLGIAVSAFLGDVPVSVLGFGTVSSAVTGALGGLLGRWLAARRARSAT